MQCCHKLLKIVETSGKIISSKWKGDIGMAWSTKKEETRGHYTAKLHKATWHHPYIFVLLFIYMQSWISNKDIGMVSCSFVQLCCVMTPCFFLFGASSHPYIPLSFWRNDFSTCIYPAGQRFPKSCSFHDSSFNYARMRRAQNMKKCKNAPKALGGEQYPIAFLDCVARSSTSSYGVNYMDYIAFS